MHLIFVVKLDQTPLNSSEFMSGLLILKMKTNCQMREIGRRGHFKYVWLLWPYLDIHTKYMRMF